MSGLEGLLAGRTLVKRYRIQEVIGRGGFAAVYRADDERLGRPVAVKIITLAAADAEAREHLRERFQREARAAASLPQHPNVVTVHDFGTDPDLSLDFLVMELLHGEDLATHLARNRKLPLDSALRILREAVEGVAVGHRANLVHRDVKPGNIFLAEAASEDPVRVCVLDFGIARVVSHDQDTRLTKTGIPLSPAYASPEQLRGERNLTCASDVFSLGVVAYQLLTGEKPLPADRTADPADWAPGRTIRELNPQVPPGIEEAVSRAMSYDASARYQDAMAMARALDDTTLALEQHTYAAAGPRVVMAAPPPSVDDERTLLHTASAGEAPSAAERVSAAPVAVPAKRPGFAKWGVALLLIGLVTVAGLWALSRGGQPTEQAAPGEMVIEEPAAPAGTPSRTTPRVTGEIVESPSAESEAPMVPSGGVIMPESNPAAPSETADRPGVILPPPAPQAGQPRPQVPAQQPRPGVTFPQQTPVQQRPTLPGTRPAPARPQQAQPQPQPQPQPQQPAPAPAPADTSSPSLLGVPVDTTNRN